MAGTVRGEAKDPADGADKLENLPETGQHTDDEDESDEAVQIGIGQKDRSDLRIGQPRAGADKSEDDQHHEDLTIGLGELLLDRAIRLVHQGPVLSLLLLAQE